ncbi:MAG: hypothetical protein JXB00_12240 [Bacteroidales bacterium]|nr:hypothetical protein [Bacteroidales bacterium]
MNTKHFKSKNGSTVVNIINNGGPMVKIIDFAALERDGYLNGSSESKKSHLILVQLSEKDLNTLDVIKVGNNQIYALSSNNEECEAMGVVYPAVMPPSYPGGSPVKQTVVVAKTAEIKKDGNVTIKQGGLAHYAQDGYNGPVTTFSINSISLAIAFPVNIELNEIKSLVINGIEFN